MNTFFQGKNGQAEVYIEVLLRHIAVVALVHVFIRGFEIRVTDLRPFMFPILT